MAALSSLTSRLIYHVIDNYKMNGYFFYTIRMIIVLPELVEPMIKDPYNKGQLKMYHLVYLSVN